MRHLLFLIPLAIFSAVAAYFALPILTGKDPRTLPSALIDKSVPDFDLPPLFDAQNGVASADLKGEVRLVNFFASWCVPCRAEHPLLTDLAASGAVPVWGLNYKDKPAAAKAWLEELGNSYGRIGVDADGRAAIDWGVYGVPETYVIDREGRIRYRHVGPITPAVRDEVLMPLVQSLQAGAKQ